MCTISHNYNYMIGITRQVMKYISIIGITISVSQGITLSVYTMSGNYYISIYYVRELLYQYILCQGITISVYSMSGNYYISI